MMDNRADKRPRYDGAGQEFQAYDPESTMGFGGGYGFARADGGPGMQQGMQQGANMAYGSVQQQGGMIGQQMAQQSSMPPGLGASGAQQQQQTSAGTAPAASGAAGGGTAQSGLAAALAGLSPSQLTNLSGLLAQAVGSNTGGQPQAQVQGGGAPVMSMSGAMAQPQVQQAPGAQAGAGQVLYTVQPGAMQGVQQQQPLILTQPGPGGQPQIIYLQQPGAAGLQPGGPQGLVLAPQAQPQLAMAGPHQVHVPPPLHPGAGGPPHMGGPMGGPGGPPGNMPPHMYDNGQRPPRQLPPDASCTLYCPDLPPDITKREAAHIFRPFAGFRDLRMVTKEIPSRPGERSTKLFVDFDTPEDAFEAIRTLDNYRLDLDSDNSAVLRPVFGRPAGERRPNDRMGPHDDRGRPGPREDRGRGPPGDGPRRMDGPRGDGPPSRSGPPGSFGGPRGDYNPGPERRGPPSGGPDGGYRGGFRGPPPGDRRDDRRAPPGEFRGRPRD